MPAGQLPLLLTAALLCRLALAEESPQPTALVENTPAVASSAARNERATPLHQLQSQLAESERQRSELSARLEATSSERESAQLNRLRQENQLLKLQLKAAQASQPSRLLSEQQTWFAIGGGVALLSLVTGLVARGGRRQRRQWIN